MKRRVFFVPLAAALSIISFALSGMVGSATTKDNRSDLKNFQHVFVIMMENTGYSNLIGNPNAPWINSTAAQFGLATQYTGVSHPSQPNYIAATSGSTNGVLDDKDVTIDVPNIVDQVEAGGRTWKAYMQSMSLCTTKLQHACGNQLYERKHNPFVSYLDVQSSASRMANIVDFGQLDSDLASGDVANYVWISPDQCNDMHGRGGPSTDPCNFGNIPGLIATGDAFLFSTVSKIMASPAWNGNSVIFVTWDESVQRRQRMLRRGPRRRPRHNPGHLALRPHGAHIVGPLQPLLDARDHPAGLAYRLPRLHLRLGERDPDERPGRPERLNQGRWAPERIRRPSRACASSAGPARSGVAGCRCCRSSVCRWCR